jgi:predicted SAM-dependent methyltransferase
MSVQDALRLLVHGSAWLKRRQRVHADARPIKVNLGAGLCVAPGWTHVDGSIHAMCATWPTPLLRRLYRHTTDCRRTHSEAEYLRIVQQHRFVHHGLEYGVPFKDGTVDVIYTSHMLEHLFKDDAHALLRDAHRTLKPGGRIRVAVPDLDHAVTLYQRGAKEDALAFFFSANRAGYLHPHHYMYDFELLRRLLSSAGFVGIERCSFRHGAVPDLEILDNRPEETLFVEASK